MIYLRSTTFLPALTLASFTTIGCGDDGGTSGTSEGMGSSGTSSASSDTSVDSTATSTSNATGSADSSAGGATMSETSTTASGETESATTEAETDGTECLGLDRAMCLENPLCMAIAGAEIMNPGTGPCLGEREFIDCQPSAGCAEVITYDPTGGVEMGRLPDEWDNPKGVLIRRLRR